MKKAISIYFLFLLTILNCLALTIPNEPGGYINDYAKMLSLQATNQIAAELINYEKETSNQILVVTFKSLDGESLEDFSIKLAEKWKIGTKEKDNGVILLIFKDDRKVRIEVGYGLEGALTDAICSQIIRNEIVPNFKAGNYDLGVEKAIDRIIEVTKGEYKGGNTKPASADSQNLIPLVFFLFFIIPFIAYIVILFFCVSSFGFPMGLIIGLVIIVILEVIRRIFSASVFGQTFHRGSGRWTDGFGSGGFSGGGFSGFSGGGGSFGGGGSSGDW